MTSRIKGLFSFSFGRSRCRRVLTLSNLANKASHRGTFFSYPSTMSKTYRDHGSSFSGRAMRLETSF
ncbi:hypothetical protein CLAIMM_10264 [Cladophialophora immunda]|nr:hypothetical protein CLAIMM_10264 [Cladophialophora immunda]